ncbi:DUF2637 domain-containing protein [Jiangella alkaliphila]|uniref:Homeodomain-like domain-containing protein n=1 Tax=Jiangella alkaliphila TaxID=419479 RepID=A0A1H2L7T1_9ACTN|nr:DUF2637 domain-containing protein [Jiangella alkaliphila]SDU77117.1 Homeodomain-like domain-containing protein [Jiangella alkaliphila]
MSAPWQGGLEGGARVALRTAVTGTVVIGAGAFWLSFTALTDLARRSGIDPGQAWAWPLIVDGIIVVTTVAVVAMSRRGQPAWYPWMLLLAGAAVSVLANALHAGLTDDVDVPVALAAPVAAVPPLVLVAVTHLTVVLARPVPDGAHHTSTSGAAEAVRHPGRDAAARLHRQGWSNKHIAGQLGVHPSTVGRWLTQTGPLQPLEPAHHTSNGTPAITGPVDGQGPR